jgi:hypothetical protein
MEQLRKYVGRPVNLDHIKAGETLKGLGFTCRYLPDPPEDFDEFEFLVDLGGIKNLALMVTVESMAVKRIFFGVISAQDPDVVTGLDETQVKQIFAQSGDTLSAFFDYITA